MTRWQKFLVGLLFIVVASGPGAAFLLAQTQTRADIHRNNVARCNAGNDFRDADLARWEYILHLAPLLPNASQGQREARAKFRAYITRADRHVDCSKL